MLSCGIATANDESFEIRALLAPKLETTLSSQISARIEKINITEGGAFHRGTALVRFDCAVPNAQLQKAEAELRAAK
ncbi:MAG: biotin/lipoyl-binding protein, partial [Gammaproteobacteria bacterium]|nr:biotin/lipoyl-binding protein [Gammaproteobacteria bacterium]